MCAEFLTILAADAEAEVQRNLLRPPMAPADEALQLRLQLLRRSQRDSATQDVVYALAVSKFVAAGVPLTPPFDTAHPRPTPAAHVHALLAFHGSQEAQSVVAAHVAATVDGKHQGVVVPGDEVVRCATAQARAVPTRFFLLPAAASPCHKLHAACPLTAANCGARLCSLHRCTRAA
jgi:hypothetical protein